MLGGFDNVLCLEKKTGEIITVSLDSKLSYKKDVPKQVHLFFVDIQKK